MIATIFTAGSLAVVAANGVYSTVFWTFATLAANIVLLMLLVIVLLLVWAVGRKQV
ncbi:MAG TPA: hypothetical protein VEL12_09310 [Candidatus Nitrosopolaris sp.]|nr:hypothetical protein [Candidatus Nitrosopolaris sp.]